MKATKAPNIDPLMTSSPFDVALPFWSPWSKPPMPVAVVLDALEVPLLDTELESDEPESLPTPVPSEPPAPDKPGTVARLVGVGVADEPFFDDVLDAPSFISVPSARNDPRIVGSFVSSMSPSSPSILSYLYDTVPVPFASEGAL